MNLQEQLAAAQKELYEAFLTETAPLRTALEAKVQQLHKELGEYVKPYDEQFDQDTAAVRAELQPHIDEIEKAHKIACHKEAVRARKAYEKLEKKRQAALKPWGEKWKEATQEAQAKYDEACVERVLEVNKQVELLTEEFNKANAPAHAAYLERAQAIEAQYTAKASGESQ